MVLPVLSISIAPMAIVAKQTRDSMKDVLEREYIRTLRACGISRKRILWKHALRNAVAPSLTVIGLIFISALSFSVFAETVFALPGLGSLAVTAAQTHDVSIIEGITMYFTLLVVAVNLILDICYALINPKVRFR
jgi:peptide/nickel transport system permease protein